MVQRSQLADYQRARRLRPKTGPLMGVSDLDTYVDRPLMAEAYPMSRARELPGRASRVRP